MKKKTLIISICLFLVTISVSLTFVYFSISTEPSIDFESDRPKSHILKTTSPNENGSSIKVDSKLPPSKNQSKNSSETISRNKRQKEEVVDQTLQTSKVSDLDILGLENEKIETEIILIDGEKDQLLSNYNVVIESSFDELLIFAERLDSDRNGKVTFKSEKVGLLSLAIITKDYAVYSQKIMVGYGKYEYKVKLFKGGTLEIRVTNQENEVIKNLEVIPKKWIFVEGMKMVMPIKFDDLSGIYTLSNLLGAFEVSFKAEGYQQTPVYKLNVFAKEKAFLEIKLQKPRKIYFTVDLDVKPHEIRVSNCSSTIAFKGQEEVINEEYDLKGVAIFKDKNDQYEYQLFEGEAKSLVVKVENFVAQIVK